MDFAPNRNIQHWVFDLDGTLIDSSRDLANSINFTLQNHGLPSHSLAAIRSFIGNGSLNLMRRSLGMEHEHLALQLHQEFLDHYMENCTKFTQPYAGVQNFLHSSVPISLLTNKPQAPTLQILAHFGWTHRFSHILCGDTGQERKPSPAGLQFIMQEQGLSPTQICMVGDDLPDIQAAQAAQIPVIAILGGFGEKEELLHAKADIYVEDFQRFSRLMNL